MGILADDYRAHLRARNLRESTIESRFGILARLYRSLDERSILEATTEDLIAYLDRPSIGAAWRGIEISHLRTFYRWAILEGLIDHDPTLRLVVPRRRRRLPRPIPSSELAVALAAAPDPIKAMLYLAAYAGLRACEIAPLRGDDISHENPPVIFIREGKGGNMETVPLAPALKPIVEAMPSYGWWFPREDQTGPLPRYMVSRRCNIYLRSIGINHTLHTLRHWYASELYRITHDLRLVQELARHRDPATTVGYTKVSYPEGVAAVGKLPSF